MRTRPVTNREACELIAEWADRRLPAAPAPGPIDFTLEDACEDLCRWLADDPERDLAPVPPALLRHLRTRLLFVTAVCVAEPQAIIGRVPAGAAPELVLAALLGVQIAGTRLPREWRPQ